MNVYKLTVMVINENDLDEDDVVSLLETGRFRIDDCISPIVIAAESRDIGECDIDDHPLSGSEQKVEFERLFNEPEAT